MTVISYGREPGYPKTTRRLEGQPPSRKVVTRHRDRRLIIVDNENDFGEVILSQLPFQIGDAFDFLGLDPPLLSGIDLERSKESRNQWYLDLDYEPLSDEDKNRDENTPPDQRQPEWYWDFEIVERPFTRDVDTDKLVASSAGEVIEMVTQYAIPILHIERHQLDFDPNTITDYVNHRNSADFWGVSPGDVLMAGISDRKDTQMIWNGTYFRKVSYVLKFAIPFIPDVQEGWTELLCDAGTYYYDIDTDDRLQFIDRHGNAITGRLDGAGFPLSDYETDPNAPPVILRFNRFPEADFNELDLGPF
jgi:hypothetical protein